MNGAEIWWWAMDMDWLGYGKRRGGGMGRTEGGGECERMGSEEAMLGIDESILCNKV